MFSVGDRVQFKSYNELKAEFGTDGYGGIKIQFGFNERMMYLCGQVATIMSIDGSGRIRTEENVEDCSTFDVVRGHWVIGADMLKLYEEESEPEPISVSDWESFIGA